MKLRKILSVFLLLLLFACGKSNSKLTEVTVVLDWTPNTNHTGLFVAKDLGYFKEEGLKVNIVQPSEDSAASIVGAGKADFGIYFQANMVKRLLKNVPITAVAAILPHNTAGLMALPSSNIKTPKDLENLRYSTWQDKIDDATVKSIVGNNLKPVPAGAVTDPVAAMKANLFDYLIVFYGWEVIDAKLKGVDPIFFYFKDYNPVLDYYSPVIIANNTFLKEHPETAKKFLKAVEKGYMYAVKNPEKAAEILIKNAPESNPELIKESQKWISKQYLDGNKPWGYIDINRWDRFYNWLYDQKLIDKKLPHSAGVTNEYLPKK